MARELGHVDVDQMLSGISYRQAREWELFSEENPLPHELIMHQLALIAYRFALAFIRNKNKQPIYEIQDFLPKFGRTGTGKNEQKTNVMDGAKGLVAALGDDKAKKKFFTEEELKPVVGKDGKRYKYALEERVPERTTPPKRKQRTKFGKRYDKLKDQDKRQPVRTKKVYNGD